MARKVRNILRGVTTVTPRLGVPYIHIRSQVSDVVTNRLILNCRRLPKLSMQLGFEPLVSPSPLDYRRLFACICYGK